MKFFVKNFVGVFWGEKFKDYFYKNFGVVVGFGFYNGVF